MIRTITVEELQSMRRGNADFLLLDVLPGEQFQDEHIEGARNIPLGSPDFLQAVARAAGSMSRRIVVYCAGEGCDAAERAARQLADAGYDDVMTYAGGIASWRQHGASVHTMDTDSNAVANGSPDTISREATMSAKPSTPTSRRCVNARACTSSRAR